MQSTRQEILQILKEQKQVTVEELATQLGLTPMTIRHHLNVLQADNLVTTGKAHHLHKAGRPRLVYTLTPKADDLFPENQGELARQLLAEVKRLMSPAETQAMLDRIADRIAADAPPAAPGQPFENRLAQVVTFLEGCGFVIRLDQTSEGYRLRTINCPYRDLIGDHQEVCQLDQALLTRLLGVTSEQQSCIARGDPTCEYLIVPPAAPPR